MPSMVDATSRGCRPLPSGVHKVFFALRPPAPTAAQIDSMARGWRRETETAGALTPPERLHVSLNGLGAYRQPPRDLVRRAGAVVPGLRVRPFRLALNRLGGWGRGEGDHPVVLWGDEGVIGAERLHDALHAALAAADLVPRTPSPFAPHVTLWRQARRSPERAITPVSWWVDELLLLASVQGEGRHEVLGRWRLAG